MREIGIDEGEGDIAIEERYVKPTVEFPHGSYLRIVAGKVEIATGWYEKEYPGHPSFYFHGGAPFVVLDHIDVPWGTPIEFDGAVERIIARVDKYLPQPKETE